jgi:glycosyltransferase involved in cell wall biosynthesis
MGFSAVLVAKDEADRIGPCLASLAWAEEIVVVVDAATTDDTAALCQQAGARVFHEPWRGFAGQFQFALDQATQDWVLMLAADERVTPELATELQALAAGATGPACMEVPIRTVFWRRGLSGHYPDYHLRVCRRGAAHIPPRLIHEALVPIDPQGAVGRLQGDILHESYRDLSHYLAKLVQYAELGAQQLHQERPVTNIGKAWRHACFDFVKYYFLKGGIRDGAPGLVYDALHAGYVFLKYARAYELSRQAAPPGVDPATHR